jgi:hypothetical protein
MIKEYKDTKKKRNEGVNGNGWEEKENCLSSQRLPKGFLSNEGGKKRSQVIHVINVVLEDEGFEGVHASEKEVAKKKRKS